MEIHNVKHYVNKDKVINIKVEKKFKNDNYL